MYKNPLLFYLTEQYSAQFFIKTAAVNKMELIFLYLGISVTLVVTGKKTLSRNESQIFKVKLGTVLF